MSRHIFSYALTVAFTAAVAFGPSLAQAPIFAGKTVNLIAERVKVTDASGHPVDIKAALSAPVQTGSAEDDDDADDADDAAEVGPDDTDQA